MMLQLIVNPVTPVLKVPLRHRVLDEHPQAHEPGARMLHAGRVHAEHLFEPGGHAVADRGHPPAAEVAAAQYFGREP